LKGSPKGSPNGGRPSAPDPLSGMASLLFSWKRDSVLKRNRFC
jgi:hypothetical protein